MLKKVIPILLLISLLTTSSFAIIGQNAPNFRFPDKNGKIHTLKQYKGKIVLLQIWATWCGPCRRSMPRTQALHEKYKSQGLNIIAINIEGRNSPAPAYIKNNSYTFKVLYSEGAYGKSIMNKLNVRGIPYMVLIDKQGVIRYAGHPLSLSEELINNALKDKLPDVKLLKLTSLIGNFEKYISWNSQNSQWRYAGGRKKWVKLLVQANDLKKIKQLIILLEKSLLKTALKPSWQTRKNIWLKKINAATKINELTPLIIELESAIKIKSLHRNWHLSLKRKWMNIIKNL